jgi:DNA gyrase/topoisomerase IV subunit B
MSFVNSIATTKGGRHVDHVSTIIEKNLAETLKKKNKGGIVIKPHQVNALIGTIHIRDLDKLNLNFE